MHEIHTLAFTLYKVFLTVAQLEEVTRREFIDTAADGLVGLQSRLECLLLTSDCVLFEAKPHWVYLRPFSMS